MARALGDNSPGLLLDLYGKSRSTLNERAKTAMADYKERNQKVWRFYTHEVANLDGITNFLKDTI